ncbi:hypothetical protein Tsubulata_030516 [Turnera subulata]|uniref:Small ribosomal subunit protein mS38 n=1 Tax=Turnera subulata TaxID=218843 RepID=A0A9Q0GEB9_9ROSI|nr:hypothetical protein Tsubulata_030516 [Turnera subulata]
MANLLQKLIKKSPKPPPLQSLRIVTATLNPAPPPNPTKSSEFTAENPIPLFNPAPCFQSADPENHFKLHSHFYYYPNSPFGFSLNPIPASGFDQAVPFEADGGGGDDEARTLWADSVKKKRKRKMNKHKYRKLRKRLRRKARA